MPTPLHEIIIELFRAQPSLASEVLGEALHRPLPAWTSVAVLDSALNELVPAELRTDLTLLYGNTEPVHGVIVEVQLRRDPDKAFSWPLYATSLRARHRCKVTLLVVTPDRSVARWAQEPIDLGGGSIFLPQVLGPADLPRPIPEQARERPHLALLALLAHARKPADAPLVRDVLDVVAQVRPDRALEYTHLVLASLDEAVRVAVEDLMKPIRAEDLHPLFKPAYAKGREEGREEGRQEGREEGRAEMLLFALEARGIGISEEQRARILSCEDSDQLVLWLRRAVQASSADEIFLPE